MTPAQTRDLAVASVHSAALIGAGVVAAFGGDWFRSEAIKREQSMRKQALGRELSRNDRLANGAC